MEQENSAKRFEELRIWQDARALVGAVYKDLAFGTAGGRDRAFCGHVRRAAISTMNNIAEGFERSTNADFVRFLNIAKGSCGEVRSLYYLAEDLGYVSQQIAAERRGQTERISRGAASLAAHLRANKEARR